MADWEDTRTTLHMWTQIVGKIRMAKAPMVNHWWNVPLYVTPRGLTTSAIPDGHRNFEIEFNFCTQNLTIDLEGGERRNVPLEPKSIAAFHRQTMAALADLGIRVTINTRPTEVERTTRFDEDTAPAAYNPDAARTFWRQLVQADRVFAGFRGRFTGKVSPVHFFWGSFDLACTRFSGRPAPKYTGSLPNVGNWVMEEGYSHELSSIGFWPGGEGEGLFYSYAYPEPDGFREHPVRPEAAYYYKEGGEFVLPYTAVRTAADPDATLLEFLNTTYEAAADLGRWDRSALEADPNRRTR